MKTNLILNYNDLMQLVKDSNISIEWERTSAIGPNWIGVSFSIDFYKEDLLIEENSFIQALKSKFIQKIEPILPNDDYMISGEGVLLVGNQQLFAISDWAAAIPYEEPTMTGEEKLLLYRRSDV